MNKNKRSQLIETLYPSLMSILVGILIGSLVLIISKPSNGIQGVVALISGPFRGNITRGLGNMLYYAAPIMLTGLSVGFAFKTGLFNIGASGQFFAGTFAALVVGVRATAIPVEYRWIAALVAAFFAGAILAGISGILKAVWNVNEVISSIMLNYISMYWVVDYIKTSDLYNVQRAEAITIPTKIPTMGLDKLFPGSFIGGSVVIAIIAAIVIYIIIDKTKFGYELKAVGNNRDAARYAGINEKRSIILSMFIAGGLAGMSGAVTYLVGSSKHIGIETIIPSEGFDGIAVSLLANNHPLGIIFSAIFMGYLKISSQAMQTIGFVPEIVDMVVAIILYVSAISVLFTNIRHARKQKKTSLEQEEVS